MSGPAGCLAALASNALSRSWLVTLRWRLLFFPDHRERRLAPLFRAVVVGQMLNIVVPLRLGEVARMYLVAEDERLSKARVLATLAVEKALDLGMFALAVGRCARRCSSFPAASASGEAHSGASASVARSALWGLSRFSDRLDTLGAPRGRPAAVAVRVPGHRHRRTLPLRPRLAQEPGRQLWRRHRGPWRSCWWRRSTNYLLFLAFGLRLPFVAALFLLVLTQAGIGAAVTAWQDRHLQLPDGGRPRNVRCRPRHGARATRSCSTPWHCLPKVILGAAFVAAHGSTGICFASLPA